MGTCKTCATRLGIVYIVILNVLTLLLGIGLIVLAIFLRKEINKEEEIMDFLAEIEFSGITLKDIITIIFIAVIAIGGFAILTSLIGGCGAMCKVRCLLITYIIILVLCILVELAIVGFWVFLLKNINDFLLESFNDLMKEYNGPLGKDVISVGWNFIFVLFGCCGVKPVTSNYNDFMTLPSEWWSSDSRLNTSDVIPSSCCDDVTIKTYMNYNNTECTQQMMNYSTSGCYDIFDETFTKLATAAIAVFSIIIIVEIVAIFFSCLVTCFAKEGKSKIV